MADEADPTVMGVGVDIYPEAREFPRRLKRQIDPEMARLGRELGRRLSGEIGSHIASGMSLGVRDGGRAAMPHARRQGAAIGQEIGDQIKEGVRAAVATLPDVELHADLREVTREVTRLRRQLESLSDVRVAVDVAISEETLTRVAALRRDLMSLSRTMARIQAQPSVRVEVEASGVAQAAAEIAALREEINRLRAQSRAPIPMPGSGPRPGPRSGPGSGSTGADGVQGIGSAAAVSARNVNALAVAGASLGPLIVPAAGAATVAVLGLGAAAGVGAIGIGVAALAVTGVSDAVQALSTYQSQAGQRAVAYAQAQAQIAAAADAVRQAREGVRVATEAAAQAEERAARQVVDSDRRVASSKEDLRRAQLAVVEAQRIARQEAEDLAARQAGGVRAERQAVISLERARLRLNAVAQDKNASQLDRDQAQLDYDEAIARLEDQRRENGRLAEEKKRSDAEGIDGSERVRAAQDQVTAAVEALAAAERAASDARAAQTQQAIDSARSIAQAQRGVVAAQRSLEQATVSAGQAGRASMDQLNEAMGKLSPTGQSFARFLFGLSDVWMQIKGAAEESFLPGLQTAIEILLPYVPQVTSFIRGFGRVLGDLAVKGAKALTAPFWRQFFAWLGRIAGPTLNGMFDLFLAVAEGFAVLVQAFTPLAGKFGAGLVKLAKDFAVWAAGFVKSDGFKEFVAYVQRNAPLLGKILLDLLLIGLKLLIAFAPLGEILLRGLVMVLDFLASMDPAVLMYIAGAVLAIVGGLVALAGGPFTLIIIGAVAVVAALVAAYQRFSWFRDVVQAVFQAVGAAAVWLWRTVLQPAFRAWWGFAQTMAGIYLRLWRDAIRPALEGIGAAAVWLWHNVLQPAFRAWWGFAQTMASIYLWLWRNVLVPVWRGIQVAIAVAWAVIKIIFGAIRYAVAEVLAPLFLWWWRSVTVPVWKGVQIAISIAWTAIKIIFGLMQIFVKTVLAPVFTWFYDNVIKPVWNGISSTIKYVWEHGIKPLFTAFGGYIKEHVAPAFRTGVDAIKTAWERVKDVAKVPIKFVVETVLNEGIIKGYNWLAEKFGVDKVAPITLPKGFAGGGVLPGWTPGRDVHQFYSPTAGRLELSGGEAIMRPEFTAAVGAGFVHAGNAAARRGGVQGVRSWLAGGGPAGYANGGVLDGPVRRYASGGIVGALSSAWNAFMNPGEALRGAIDELLKKIPGSGSMRDLAAKVGSKTLDSAVSWFGRIFGRRDGGDGGSVGAGGLRSGIAGVLAELRARFGNVPLISGLRPGSTTLTGNRSYHADGRAIDVAAVQEWAAFLNMAYGGQLRELITPWQVFNVHNGRPHTYTGAVWNQHNFAGGNAHIHAALRRGGFVPKLYDQGGWLPTGLSIVENRTGRPEAVLTNREWEAMHAERREMQKRAGRGGNTYNIYPRTSVLDERGLQNITDAQDMRDRVGRES